MESFILCRDGKAADILLEQNSVYGMSYMTGIFCEDIERVCGVYPHVVQELPENSKYAVLIATCGSSEWHWRKFCWLRRRYCCWMSRPKGWMPSTSGNLRKFCKTCFAAVRL